MRRLAGAVRQDARFILAVVLLFLLALVVPHATWSAFSATTANPGNTGTAATLTLTDNDSGSAMFSMSNMLPTDTDSGCVQVTYNGDVPARVRPYGTTTGTGLDAYLDLVVTRGTVSSGSFDSCAAFSADGTNYLGSGNGVVYSGTLQGFADSFDAATTDPKIATPETWTTGETHAYKFQVTLQNNASAASLNATQTFTWEARSVPFPLSQQSGTSGCVSETGTSGSCVDGKGLDGAEGLAISPDGGHLYAASIDGNSVAAFARNSSTGVLTQLSSTNGCVSETGTSGTCVDGKALLAPESVVVSPDGSHVYVPASTSDAVAAFARNSGTGVLTQLSSTNGCVSETGTSGNCVDGKALDGAEGIAISPDGNYVYVVSETSDAVAVFSRNSGTGVLTQLSSASGCTSETGTSGNCVDGKGLDGPEAVAVSPDGTSLYAASNDSDSIAVFSRNVSTGVLTQLSSTSGCVSETGTSGNCTDGKALVTATDVDVSPDGKYVYVASEGSNAVAVFARNLSTGALTQLSSTSGCVSETGTSGACADGVALQAPTGVRVSPDGQSVYVGSNTSDGVVTFSRDASTGVLTQLTGTSGCITETGTSGACVDGVALDGTFLPIVSPDNKDVYICSYDSDSISVLVRGR